MTSPRTRLRGNRLLRFCATPQDHSIALGKSATLTSSRQRPIRNAAIYISAHCTNAG